MECSNQRFVGSYQQPETSGRRKGSNSGFWQFLDIRNAKRIWRTVYVIVLHHQYQQHLQEQKAQQNYLAQLINETPEDLRYRLPEIEMALASVSRSVTDLEMLLSANRKQITQHALQVLIVSLFVRRAHFA